MPASTDEVFVGLDVPRHLVPLTTKFRSTWIVASQGALRTRGFFDRYMKLLPEAQRDAVLTTVVGTWIPVELAVAHYTACDRLALSSSEQYEIGRILTGPMNNSLLGFTGHLAREAGATPWTLLAHVRRIWERMWVGGAIAVYKEGPKQARVELVACALAPVPYFRTAMRGVLAAVGEKFCTKLYLKEIPTRDPTAMVYRGSWV
ncbi:MAG TPA: hypothetical protein VNO21_26525 [Polyangiaceae bacterium]|nr:hypothetical protein [Polyangiaceae bacterium]